ncbi:MAG: GGDEF domain-containing protein [Pirellulaceae bacterium]
MTSSTSHSTESPESTLTKPSPLLAEILRSKHLPSLPAVALQVVKLCRNEEVRVTDLAEIVSLEPALSAKLLHLANSARYSRGHKITTVPRACTVLGLKALKIMSLSFSLAESMHSKRRLTDFDYQTYWERSICTAVAGRNFARYTNQGDQEEAFFCGLVSRIGQLAMANAIPSEYGDVLVATRGAIPEAEQELAILGCCHNDVARELLHSWELPESLVNGVANWSAARDNHECDILSKIVLVADRISSLLCEYSDSGKTVDVFDIAYDLFGLSHGEIADFIVSLQDEVKTLAELLNVDQRDVRSYQDIVNEARNQIVEISLETNLDLESSKRAKSELEGEKQRWQEAAQTDALTGIPNRREFDRRVQAIIDASCRTGISREIAVVLIDVDHFKKLNDTHGHLAGDEALKQVAKCLAKTVRQTDFVGRIGGEEFAALLTNISFRNLSIATERIRRAVENLKIEYKGQSLKVTVSLGAVRTAKLNKGMDITTLMEEADKLLYLAKDSGRNCAKMAEA